MKDYASLAACAEKRAAGLRTTATTVRARSSGGSFARASRKGQSATFLESEASRFERMARDYRRKIPATN